MKKILIILFCLLPLSLLAQKTLVRTIVNSDNTVSFYRGLELLELSGVSDLYLSKTNPTVSGLLTTPQILVGDPTSSTVLTIDSIALVDGRYALFVGGDTLTPHTLATEDIQFGDVLTEITGQYNVRNYGAVPNDTTNDYTSAIQAACDAAFVNRGTVYAAGDYKITSTITIQGDADMSRATFYMHSLTDTAVIWQDASNAMDDSYYNKNVLFPRVIQLAEDQITSDGIWNGTSVGICVLNGHGNNYYIPYVRFFTTGVLLTNYKEGTELGIGWCTFKLNDIYNNKLGLVLRPGDDDGWINENLFIGGTYALYTVPDIPIAGARGILIDSSMTIPAFDAPSSNYFIKPDIGNNLFEYSIECYGNHNTFVDLRGENAPTIRYSLFDDTRGASYNKVVSGIFGSTIVLSDTIYCYNNTYKLPGDIDRPVYTGNVVAANGIDAKYISRIMVYNGDSAIDISKNPQIAPGDDRQVIEIWGTSDVNTLKLDTSNGLWLGGGSITLGNGDVIVLRYDSTNNAWLEVSRSNN